MTSHHRFSRRRLVLAAAGIVLLSPLLLLTIPRARAAVRWTPGFVPLAGDPRVYHEPGAESLALRIAEALPDAVARVEEVQGAPFTPGFRVYVPATHASFTRWIGHPPSTPVRGIAFPWDVWVSPLAFDFHGRDTHRQSLAHELSHLHLGQRLGWLARTGGLPTWYFEGLADLVADTGEERISRDDALRELRAGRGLVPDDTGHLPLPKGPEDYGVSWPQLHLQSRMFLEHLRARDAQAFRQFVRRATEGGRFGAVFEESFGAPVTEAWEGFLTSLRSPSETDGAAAAGPAPAFDSPAAA